jgi:hypothetical protein
MELPAALKERLKGKKVTDLNVVQIAGASIVGTKTAILSDGLGVYLHDTGGILGVEKVHARDSIGPTQGIVLFSKKRKKIRVFTKFEGGTTAAFESLSGAATAAKKLKRVSWRGRSCRVDGRETDGAVRDDIRDERQDRCRPGEAEGDLRQYEAELGRIGSGYSRSGFRAPRLDASAPAMSR